MQRRAIPGSHRRVEARFLDISHCGETYRVNLRSTVGARRFTLRVRAVSGEVVLTMPERASLGDARSFAERHAAWIGVRLERLPRRKSFAPDEIVPLRGLPHKITHRPSGRGTVWIEPSASGLADGAAMPLLCVNAEPCFVPRRVRDFLVREAHRDLEGAVTRYAQLLGVRAHKLALRDPRSRWGSCSSRGALSFSWRLIMAPSFVLDYLAAHEVTHLLHMNHSAAFWSAVSEVCPATDRAETWLRAHGASLHSFSLEAVVPR